MKTRFLASIVLALAASAGASEIPPAREAEARTVLVPGSSLDAVEARELADKGPGPQAGRPLTRDEKSWIILGFALLAVLLVSTV